jgi:hypothetical protein
MSFSSSIVCRIAFGKSNEHEGSETSRFHGLLDEAQAIPMLFHFRLYSFHGGLVDRVDNTSIKPRYAT